MQVAGVFGKERFNDYSGPSEDRILGSVHEHHVGGWGLDAGATWKPGGWGQPYLTLGYAFGSGNKGMQETHDTGFRQTGLQDNSDRMGGVVSFRYYGMLLDPELSNLHVLTAGLGFRLFEKSSIDFLYHRYRQAEAADFLRDVGFKRDPTGQHKAIGQEWDLIVGIEDWEPVEFRLVGSIFRPGKAFEPEVGELSYLVTFRVRLNF